MCDWTRASLYGRTITCNIIQFITIKTKIKYTHINYI